MDRRFYCLLIFCGLSWIGCGISHVKRVELERILPDAIQVVEKDNSISFFENESDIRRPYVIIGTLSRSSISGDRWADETPLTIFARREAREEGADAIVDFRIEFVDRSREISTPSCPPLPRVSAICGGALLPNGKIAHGTLIKYTSRIPRLQKDVIQFIVPDSADNISVRDIDGWKLDEVAAQPRNSYAFTTDNLSEGHYGISFAATRDRPSWKTTRWIWIQKNKTQE